MNIVVRIATANDIDAIENLYNELNYYLETHENYPCWKKGVYPIREDAEEALVKEDLYVAIINGNIAGTVVYSNEQEGAYREVEWQIEFDVPVITICKLAVHPKYFGCGVGKALLDYADCENQTESICQAEAQNILGMDYAMEGMAVLSDGTRCIYPSYYRKMEGKLTREQRKLSKCEKGSRNYQKQRKKVALCHERIRNQRKDFQHKLSRRLADEYDAIAVEDLNMKAMSRCLNLGKGIMDNGYSQFVNMLSYKLEELRKKMVKVDRYYPSSKTCSKCGKLKETLSLSERIYKCECGNEMDRDVNAAINLREEGRRILCA